MFGLQRGAAGEGGRLLRDATTPPLPALRPPGTRPPPPAPRVTQGDEDEIAKLTGRMKALLGPFVLRRLKAEVAGQLTAKTHRTGARTCPAHAHGPPAKPAWPTPPRPPPTHTPPAPAEMVEMTSEQAALYRESVTNMRSQISGRAASAATDQSEKGVEKLLRRWVGSAGWLGGWVRCDVCVAGVAGRRGQARGEALAPASLRALVHTAPLPVAARAAWAPRRSATCSPTCARLRSTRC